MIHKNRGLARYVLVAACMLAANFAVAEETMPSATLNIESTSIALGVGVNWGHGTLKYKGKEYKFKLSGLSVVDLGVSKISATGEVYNLENLRDFTGNYITGSASAVVGQSGGGAAYLENEHDVTLKIKSKGDGVQFTLAPAGVRIKLEE